MNFPGFVGPSYVSQSLVADAEECYNFYVENLESPSAKSRLALYPTPGLKQETLSPLSPNRCMFAQAGRSFCVIGAGFFEIGSSIGLTQWGTVDVDNNPATINSSGDQLFITAGGSGYAFDLASNTFTPIIGLIANQGGYLDGFFLALDSVNSKLRISAFRDALTWPVLQFRLRDAAPDPWVAMIVVHNEIWLMGTETYEVWYDAGSFPFPFQLRQGLVFSQGIGAPFSIVKMGESVGWMSRNSQGQAMFMISDQYAPQRVSNYAVELSLLQAIQDGSSLSDGVSLTYQEQGHTFWAITFREADITWCYDQTTQMWHKRAFWKDDGSAPAHYTAWRPMYHCYAFDKHLVGDNATGQIYSMGIDKFLDADGQVIRRLRRSPHVFNEKKYVSYPRFELDMEVGVGNLTGQGVDPIVMFRQSNDGGYNWGNEHHMHAGKRGVRSTRVFINRLSRARDKVVEISCSDPVPWRIVNAYLEVRPGTA